jgi:hypothetical protein
MNTEPTPAMNTEPLAYPARERAAADHDEPYTWARPAGTYLSPREIARLLLFRSHLLELEADRLLDFLPSSSARTRFSDC